MKKLKVLLPTSIADEILLDNIGNGWTSMTVTTGTAQENLHAYTAFRYLYEFFLGGMCE